MRLLFQDEKKPDWKPKGQTTMDLYKRITFSDVEDWLAKRGEEANAANFGRDFGLSVWTAADTLAYYVGRGDLREERRGEPFEGVYFASVYRVRH